VTAGQSLTVHLPDKKTVFLVPSTTKWRTLMPVPVIWMLVAPLPVRSLMLALYLVEGSISLMPCFCPPLPVTTLFAVIPLMVVLVIAVMITPLVLFIPFSGVLFAVVVWIVVGSDPNRGNQCPTHEK
jgi:hypothetical protein